MVGTSNNGNLPSSNALSAFLKIDDKDNGNKSDVAESMLQSRIQSIQQSITVSQQTQASTATQQMMTVNNVAPATQASATIITNNTISASTPIQKIAPVQTTTATTDSVTSLDAQKSDFGGKMTSFSKNGIHIIFEDPDHMTHTPGTMTWIDTGKAAAGFGIAGNGNKTKDTGAESVTVDLDESADLVEISLVDHGTKNSDDSITFTVYQESGDETEVTLTLDSNAPDKVTTFSFDAADYGDGSMISQVVFSSTSNLGGGHGEASFLIGGVETTIYGTAPAPVPLPTPDPDPAPTPDPTDDPLLIVGHNVNDTDASGINYAVGDGNGTITGGNNNDVLIGDFGGATTQAMTQDHNINLILDVSGSMWATASTGETRLQLMVKSVNSLLADFAGYTDGTIQVHLTAFSTDVYSSGTFTVTSQSGYADVLNYTNSLLSSYGGVTNYEAALQDAITWLQSGSALANATTTTYFLSDGFPNYALDDAGNPIYPYYSGTTAMGEILGSDGTNEVALIQSLSDEVIGVGIDIGYSITNLDIIDTDGSALNVPADQLEAALQATSPLMQLATAGSDVIIGNAGNDIIFGDAVNTDDLGAAHGLQTIDGDGWEVFTRLEAGESATDQNWSRDDTLAYIQNNSALLGTETVTAEGNTRAGGDDVLNGGAGDDIIFGQEGNDILNGGHGVDTLYGGSGADVFLFESIADAGDIIKDFNVGEGDALDLSLLISSYDPLQHSIDNFVYVTESGGNTTVSVDVAGTGNQINAVDMVTLEGVVGLDVIDMTNEGSLMV